MSVYIYICVWIYFVVTQYLYLKKAWSALPPLSLTISDNLFYHIRQLAIAFSFCMVKIVPPFLPFAFPFSSSTTPYI